MRALSDKIKDDLEGPLNEFADSVFTNGLKVNPNMTYVKKMQIQVLIDYLNFIALDSDSQWDESHVDQLASAFAE